MTITLMYLWPLDARSQFLNCALKWTSSYLAHPSEVPHEVLICMSNGSATAEDEAIFSDIPHRTCGYAGGGWDIGSYQSVAQECDSDMVVFSNTRTNFWKNDWLLPFVNAFERFGPKGLYGATASYERCPINMDIFPNPHIRTACFATSPNQFRKFPYIVDSREKGFRFESGDWNFCDWYADHGWPVKMVAADGQCYDRPQWRRPDNIFRRGNQSNVLVRDRHTDAYDAASPDEKNQLDATAGLSTIRL